MNIVVYQSFSKRENSTKQPLGGYEVECKLKQPTSWDSPVFQLKSSDLAITHVYCPNNGHYYFVNSITQVTNDIIELNCSEDVLATYKSAILGYNCFVERSSTNYDSYINDEYLSSRQTIQHQYHSTTEIPHWNTGGCYLVRVVNGEGASSSGITTYVLGYNDISNLLNSAFAEGTYGETVADSIVLSVFNPMEYIVSIMWFPFSIDYVSDSLFASNIKLGWWTMTATGYKLGSSVVGKGFNVTLDRPSAYFNDFRDNNAQYTRYSFWLPGVGLVDVDPLDVSQGIIAEYYVDFITGDCNVILANATSSGRMFASLHGKVGIPIQIGQSVTDVGSVVSSVASAVSSGVAKNYLASATSLVSAVSNIFNKTISTLGGVGNITQMVALPYAITYRTIYGTATFPNTIGRPCYKNLQLGTLSGFTKCGNASIDIGAFNEEREQINDYLNNGFYIE
jgi:hypothetical protein